MKRKALFVVAALLVLALCLTACGSKQTKVSGLMAGVGTEQIHPLVYGNSLLNDKTIAENDYVLEVGESYLLAVAYAQTGGSILAIISADDITLSYDAEVLQITQPEETHGELVYYNLVCLKPAVNTAVIVETAQYSFTVIVTAKMS